MRKLSAVFTLLALCLAASPAFADADLHGTTWVSDGGSYVCGIRSLKFDTDPQFMTVTVEATWSIGAANWSWKDGKLILDFRDWDASFEGVPKGADEIDATFKWTPQGGYDRVDACVFRRR